MDMFLDPREDNNYTSRGFHGWSAEPPNINHADKMSEQNRLMYLYHNDYEAKKAYGIWPVPWQKSKLTNTSSCPEAVKGHTPSLQNDRHSTGSEREEEWPMCFLNYYTNNKDGVYEVLERMQRTIASWKPVCLSSNKNEHADEWN
jgi:hypothetical protein